MNWTGLWQSSGIFFVIMVGGAWFFFAYMNRRTERQERNLALSEEAEAGLKQLRDLVRRGFASQGLAKETLALITVAVKARATSLEELGTNESDLRDLLTKAGVASRRRSLERMYHDIRRERRGSVRALMSFLHVRYPVG